MIQQVDFVSLSHYSIFELPEGMIPLPTSLAKIQYVWRGLRD
jgi:hypothetical protein